MNFLTNTFLVILVTLRDFCNFTSAEEARRQFREENERDAEASKNSTYSLILNSHHTPPESTKLH